MKCVDQDLSACIFMKCVDQDLSASVFMKCVDQDLSACVFMETDEYKERVRFSMKEIYLNNQ